MYLDSTVPIVGAGPKTNNPNSKKSLPFYYLRSDSLDVTHTLKKKRGKMCVKVHWGTNAILNCTLFLFSRVYYDNEIISNLFNCL